MLRINLDRKSYAEWEALINSASLVQIYPEAHKNLYASDVRYEFVAIQGGETKPELYATIRVFNQSGAVTKRAFGDYMAEENAWRVAKLAELDQKQAEKTQRQELKDRLSNIKQPNRTLVSLGLDEPNFRKYFNELIQTNNTAQIGLIEDHWVNVIEPLVMQERTRKRNIKRAKDNARTFVEGLDLANLSPQEREDLLVHMARMVFGLG